MFLPLAFAFLTLIGSAKAANDDMDDADFYMYVKVHHDFAVNHGESLAKNCVDGAISGAFTFKGFDALCIGCAVGVAKKLGSDMLFPPKVEENKGSFYYGY